MLLAGGGGGRLDAVAGSLGEAGRASSTTSDRPGPTSSSLAGPAGSHVDLARSLSAAGVPVVSTCDDPADVEALLDLDPKPRRGAEPSSWGPPSRPGLYLRAGRPRRRPLRRGRRDPRRPGRHRRSGLRPPAPRAHSAAPPSTGATAGGCGAGPARAGSCAGSPIRSAPRDCYRAALPDALLLVPAFPGVDRVTARLAANRRDRLTARLPMLRRPHPEGGPGRVRVEVRGDEGHAPRPSTCSAPWTDRRWPPARWPRSPRAWRREGALLPERGGGPGRAGRSGQLPRRAGHRGVKAAAFEGTA